jgi:hypothetical protein
VRFPLPNLCIGLVALVLACPFVRAQDGLSGALVETGSARTLLHITLGQKLAAADFDNDQLPDGAVLLDAGEFLPGGQLFRIRLHLSAARDQDLIFQSNETGLTISALDVNQDGAPDLVVEQVLTRKRLGVWLNDGHGKFRPARVEDFPASADAPGSWKSPLEEQGYLVLALPSRTGCDSPINIAESQRYDSPSSNWRDRGNVRRTQTGSLASHSPRSPPVSHSL